MTVRTTHRKEYRYDCDVPSCAGGFRGAYVDEDQAAEDAVKGGWAFVSLDGMGFRWESVAEGEWVHLCPKHADLADTVLLVIALQDRRTTDDLSTAPR